MANHLDVPRSEADAMLSQQKIAPQAAWRPSAISQRTQKPNRTNYKFSLFLSEHGRPQRVYQLDTTSVPVCAEGKHDWPHEHIGQDRVVFGRSFPADFTQAIAHFRKTANVKFEEPIKSPFDFELK
jgi:hypothetical protein